MHEAPIADLRAGVELTRGGDGMREEDLLERVRAMEVRLARVEVKRDAAVADLELTADCRTCGKNRGFGRCDSKGGTCKYQWRGAQGEG